MQESWLFIRGPRSVRLERDDNVGYVHLSVSGPESDLVTYEFPDLSECRRRQAEIELRVLAAGYHLAQASSERRREQGMRRGGDHRRAQPIVSSATAEHTLSDRLFWSRRGEIACTSHAPDACSERWQADGWCSIPESAHRRHGLAYQCPRCAPDGRAYRHVRVQERKAIDLC